MGSRARSSRGSSTVPSGSSTSSGRASPKRLNDQASIGGPSGSVNMTNTNIQVNTSDKKATDDLSALPSMKAAYETENAARLAQMGVDVAGEIEDADFGEANRQTFAAMVPDALLRPGANRVRLYQVERTPAGPQRRRAPPGHHRARTAGRVSAPPFRVPDLDAPRPRYIATDGESAETSSARKTKAAVSMSASLAMRAPRVPEVKSPAPPAIRA